MALTREQVVAYLSALSPAELHELIRELEHIWGLERSVGSPSPSGEHREMFMVSNLGPEGWDVVLLEVGPQRIAMIVALREGSNLSLGEARALVDAAPVTVREELTRWEAGELVERLRAVGATVELR